jgi:hypothetical protein
MCLFEALYRCALRMTHIILRLRRTFHWLMGLTKVMNYPDGELRHECGLCDLKKTLWHKLLKCVFM